jgi:hypothetical protein
MLAPWPLPDHTAAHGFLEIEKCLRGARLLRPVFVGFLPQDAEGCTLEPCVPRFPDRLSAFQLDGVLPDQDADDFLHLDVVGVVVGVDGLEQQQPTGGARVQQAGEVFAPGFQAVGASISSSWLGRLAPVRPRGVSPLEFFPPRRKRPKPHRRTRLIHPIQRLVRQAEIRQIPHRPLHRRPQRGLLLPLDS